MYKHILIPTDGAPLSSHAIGKAMTLAKDMGAKVTVLTCTEPLRIFSLEPEQVARTINNYKEEASKQAHRILAAARQEAEMLGVPCETLEVEHGHGLDWGLDHGFMVTALSLALSVTPVTVIFDSRS